MEYFKCKWIHEFEDEPILIYSELDDGRNEVRKVEVYRNGNMYFACKETHSGYTELAYISCPTVDEINESREFEAEYIDKVEFDKLFDKLYADYKSAIGFNDLY